MSGISKLSAFFNNCVSYLPSLGEALTTTFSNGCSLIYSAEITLKRNASIEIVKKKKTIFTELPPVMISRSFGKTMAIWIGEHTRPIFSHYRCIGLPTLQNRGCSELFLPGKRFASKSMVRVPEIK
ncbi:Uncharacterized protein BM_BM1441 [Brugia malayi]|uniref:Bm1441, isoform b n=1 Tax=Brugia malayi TaxID=6279 RepID=A0A4E9FPP6_BRUMA|nr:Uncharacterized protein BM_BM1441 [Brugia malayi]VIO98790.1 Uncharacterized protein BM_BM1441 [Brugia malayi]